jgi:hypothetical protein
MAYGVDELRRGTTTSGGAAVHAGRGDVPASIHNGDGSERTDWSTASSGMGRAREREGELGEE